MARTATTHAWRRAVTSTVLLSALACNCRTQQQPPVESRPAPAAATATPAESAPATKPAAQATKPTEPAPPATRPTEELPPSTFDTAPPYTVQLYVRKPEDKQPGWLKILALADEHATAKARGVFPRQNITEVETENVRRIQIELGYLPLAENKRVVLRIDNQGIEITQRDRQFITLERRPTGQWAVEPPPKE